MFVDLVFLDHKTWSQFSRIIIFPFSSSLQIILNTFWRFFIFVIALTFQKCTPINLTVHPLKTSLLMILVLEISWETKYFSQRIHLSHMIFSFLNDKAPLAPKYSGVSSLEVLHPSIFLIRLSNRMLRPFIFLICFSDRISLLFYIYKLAF